jgi:hypothetical protein
VAGRDNALVPTSRPSDGQRPQTGPEDQRRLHAWPAWDESVRLGRHQLAFDPAWTPRPGEAQCSEYAHWRHETELVPLLAESKRAVTDLHLPDAFRDYWIACFLAPYEREGFESIRDPQPTGDVTSERVYPPRPELWFTAGIDYSVAPYMLVIEGPAALASTTVLRAAVQRAMEAKRRSGLAAQHPLVHARQIGPVAENRTAAWSKPNAARERAVRQARAWSANGSTDIRIARGLTGRGYQVSARTVGRWLGRSSDEDSDTPS